MAEPIKYLPTRGPTVGGEPAAKPNRKQRRGNQVRVNKTLKKFKKNKGGSVALEGQDEQQQAGA